MKSDQEIRERFDIIDSLYRRDENRKVALALKQLAWVLETGYNTDSDIHFYKLWNDSIMELDPDTRMHLYHHLKLDFERKAEYECHAFRNFEIFRFQWRDNPRSLVVEGHCNACGYISRTFEFNEYMRLAISNYHNGVIKLRCFHCRSENALEFPILI